MKIIMGLDNYKMADDRDDCILVCDYDPTIHASNIVLRAIDKGFSTADLKTLIDEVLAPGHYIMAGGLNLYYGSQLSATTKDDFVSRQIEAGRDGEEAARLWDIIEFKYL